MSFEVLILGADDSNRLPRKTDLFRVFDGYVIEDRAPISRSALSVLPGYSPQDGDDVPLPVTSFVVGAEGDGTCEIAYTWGPDPDPVQTLITVQSPISASWLWDRILRVMQDFDVFMVIPGAPDTYAVTAQRDATIPPDLRESMPVVEVRTVDELLSALAAPPRVE